jgi:anti-sigma-K factor RskA
MKPTLCGWREEHAAQYVMGGMNAASRASFERHVRDCGRCRALVQEWSRLLAAESLPETSRSRGKPPLRLKLRLLAAALIKAVGRRWKGVPRAAAAGVLLLVLGVAAIDRVWQEPLPGERIAAVQTDSDGESAGLVMQPDSRQYYTKTVLSSADRPLHGYVWVNSRLGEMVVLIDTTGGTAEVDYQLWSIRDNRRENIGLLIQRERTAYLHVRGRDVLTAEAIAVSVEPPGGSEVPTGPDAIRVSLEK